ncbi:MAG: flagellar biosynthesis anti-sigma factor FlgM [Candidatus Accumulibacter sp.]|jgi:negative regulator of flagellin synthesis FlgM|nr:flagellar biosynthesis anti-sigma factor FlgM [Accumulibacter sp.]
MKIEQSTQPVNTQAPKETRRPTAKKAGNAARDVELSSLAAQLSASDNETPFDAGQVAEIRQAISEGRFSINASAIADRLIVSAKELIGSQHSS